MQKVICDTVHRTGWVLNSTVRVCPHDVSCTYTDWRCVQRWAYPDGDFLWVRRWTRIGPNGGNTDTVLGTVDFVKLKAFLADKPEGQKFEWHDLVAAGVATPASVEVAS